jgi:hypothetical protein
MPIPVATRTPVAIASIGFGISMVRCVLSYLFVFYDAKSLTFNPRKDMRTQCQSRKGARRNANAALKVRYTRIPPLTGIVEQPLSLPCILHECMHERSTHPFSPCYTTMLRMMRTRCQSSKIYMRTHCQSPKRYANAALEFRLYSYAIFTMHPA